MCHWLRGTPSDPTDMKLLLGKQSTPEPFSYSLQIAKCPPLPWAPPWLPSSQRLLGVAVLEIVDSVPGSPVVCTPAPPASESSTTAWMGTLTRRLFRQAWSLTPAALAVTGLKPSVLSLLGPRTEGWLNGSFAQNPKLSILIYKSSWHCPAHKREASPSCSPEVSRGWGWERRRGSGWDLSAGSSGSLGPPEAGGERKWKALERQEKSSSCSFPQICLQRNLQKDPAERLDPGHLLYCSSHSGTLPSLSLLISQLHG